MNDYTYTFPENKPKEKNRSKVSVKHDICSICYQLNRDYRILHKDARGNYYCLGCRKREATIALHEDAR